METRKKSGGRQKGTKNKVSYDLKSIMRDGLSPKATARLEKILDDEEAPLNAVMKAVELVLAYGHGKPQGQTLVGIEAGPRMSELMVRFMKPEETLKDVREINNRVIEQLDPDNPKRKVM
jgi:hypothetical protein|tara:strand:- start:811 stop:1170 length:360 start_codon:yes stop_codon:yes gene_type:complete